MTTRQHNKGGELTLEGIGVSPGVVIGPVVLLTSRLPILKERQVEASEVEHEIARFESALIDTRTQLLTIQNGFGDDAALSDASFLDAHLMLLDDKNFIEEVIKDVRQHRRNIEASVLAVIERYADALSSVADSYLRERVADFRDVARRIVRNLAGIAESTTRTSQKHIIVATDLAPSETAALRKDLVLGFATDLGSPTSHTALMARALEIPAIVALHDVSARVAMGEEVLIDGNKGVLIVNPSRATLRKYGRVAKARKVIERGLTSLKGEPAETTDGRRIVLSANTDSTEEMDAVIEYGAEGVGLFRSEYLFMSRRGDVSEDEQAEIYSAIAHRLAPAPVIIRTLDVGGDKMLQDADGLKEANPFLGCRSIRLSLLMPERFKLQLRAILRASAEGNVKVMYPMISSAAEVIQANAILEEAKKELKAEKVVFAEDIEVGAMIEVPSAALTADIIAEHVKFFSLGTNDLVQYTMAVDRVNERVAYLYEPAHPAVLKLIMNTIEAGHRHGLWVGLCGEMAADPVMTPLLLGMGVDELSVAPSAVPLVKDIVRKLTYAQSKELAETALSCKSSVDVVAQCRTLTKDVAPELLELI